MRISVRARTRLRDERGMTAVTVGVVLVGLFAAATLSVDAGKLWQIRRNMVTATDSAALAEAQLAAVGEPNPYATSCTGTYNTVLTQNAGGDLYDKTCTIVDNGDGTGYITVEARKPSSAVFGSVIGAGAGSAAFSSSSAMWGFVSEGRGLRPMGICIHNHHVEEWMALKTGAMTQEQYDSLDDVESVLEHPYYPQATGVVHRIWYQHLAGDEQCGDFPGNWGWQNYNGGNAPTPERNDMIKYGYQGSVGIHDDTIALDCPAEPGQGTSQDSVEGCVPSDSGAIAQSNNKALEAIRGIPIWIPIFDDGECANDTSGGGVTCNFETYAFISVILRGFESGGATDGRYLDFEFINSPLMSGTCCSGAPVNSAFAVKGVRLCGVDHDAVSAADRCSIPAPASSPSP